MSDYWVEVPLDQACSLVTDGTHHSPPNGPTGEFKYVTAKNIRKHGLDLTDITYVQRATHEEIFRRCPVEQGDVLYIKDGVTTGLAAVNHLAEPFSLLSSVALLKPRREVLTPAYLKHWLNSPSTVSAMTGNMTGSAIKRLVLKQIRAAKIPLPPLEEQHRIADKLDAILARVDACRERLDRVRPLLQRFRQSVLAAAVSGDLTQEWRVRSAAPEWGSCLIRDAGKIQLGRQRSPKYHSGENMRPYLRVQNVFEDRIDLADVMEMDFPGEDFERYRLLPGDILLNEGQSPRYLGRPAMYRGELLGACFTNSLIRFQPHSHVDGEFALLVFRHQMHSGRYVAEGTITTNIAHLSAGRFGSVEFPLPCVAEQREVVRRVKRLMAFADALDARLGHGMRMVAQLSPSALAKAFRGELVPQDPNDEPAAAMLARLRRPAR